MAGFFGIGNYGDSGAGISKNGPKKNRFALFFEILGVRIWKLFSLNFIYVLCCIPIITIGPATAGITKVLKNYSIDKNAYVWSDFKDTFKKNFLRALPIGIIDIIAYAGVFIGSKMYPDLAEALNNNLFYLLFVVTLSVGVMFTIMNFYMYLMLVSTDLSMKNIVKNSLALTFLAPKQNILTLFIMVALVFLFIFLISINLQFLFLLPFMPATLIGFIVCYNCYPVIQKYVINPYYESRGEVNPELPKETDEEETVFEDMGGREAPIKADKKKGKNKGKVIS